MTHMKKVLALVLVAWVVVMSGCSPSDSVAESLSDDAVIVDVRTPAEFEAGHLEGAVNVDMEAADFGDQIAEYEQAGTYFVYCRSGNRSAVAVEQMESMGFTDVTDGGGMDEASRNTGLPVVTD